MLKIFLIFTSLLLPISITAQSKTTDREMIGLKGKVKSVVSSYSYLENSDDGKNAKKESGSKFESRFRREKHLLIY
jgi:hypothetical protein